MGGLDGGPPVARRLGPQRMPLAIGRGRRERTPAIDDLVPGPFEEDGEPDRASKIDTSQAWA